MKHRINKMAAVFVVSIFALSGIGIAYAAWTDTITITGTVNTGELKWEILPGTAGSTHGVGPDWNCFFDLKNLYGRELAPEGKDVADTIVELEADAHPHKMTVTINNAYPYYYDHIAYIIHSYENIPLRIWKVNFIVNGVVVDYLYQNDWVADPYVYLDIGGPDGENVPDGEYDIEIWWGNPLNQQMHFCYTLDRSFEILVLQPAPQSSTLEFDIEYVCIQWNEWTSSAP